MNKCLPTDTCLLDVVPIDEYSRNPGSYLSKSTAIDFGGDHIFPIINDMDKGPGIIIKNNESPFAYVRTPEGADLSIYEREKMIDFTDSKDMASFMSKQSLMYKLEKDILSSPDNIFAPAPDTDDSPAMQLLKKAVTDKHIDLDKYEPRFGSNYANDKRLFNKSNISLPMLVRMCDALDIKATLTLQDKDNDIANPMGETISVEITGQGGDANE